MMTIIRIHNDSNQPILVESTKNELNDEDCK